MSFSAARVVNSLTTLRNVALSARGALFVTCVALSAFRGLRPSTVGWLVGLLVAGGVAHVASAAPKLRAPALLAEAAYVSVAVVFTGSPQSPLLPYLIAPPAAAGVTGSLLGGLIGQAVEVGLLVGVQAARPGGVSHVYAAVVTEWVMLGIGVLLFGMWMQRVIRTGKADPQQSYAAAFRLLSQLRLVARQLPVGLDSLSVAEGLLTSVAAAVPCRRAVVLVRNSSDELVPLVQRGETGDWDPDLKGDNAFSRAWLSHQAEWVRPPKSAPGPGGASYALVVPLRTGLNTFGLLALEALPAAEVGPRQVQAVEEAAREAALRLGTSLLFDEVRQVATTEERRRLAREIHDGIAQEVAAIGFLLDELIAEGEEAGGNGLLEPLTSLRREITRVVSDLRLSIFDLRTGIEPGRGIGAALAEYAQTVGRAAGFTVHLRMDEGPRRLTPDRETELLRIAQEAINNARKHARAGNLWLELEVRPPGALLRVSDDGVGLQGARPDSFGLGIMRERAERVGATLEILPRPPTGTVVEVRLAPAAVPGRRQEEPVAN